MCFTSIKTPSAQEKIYYNISYLIKLPVIPVYDSHGPGLLCDDVLVEMGQEQGQYGGR